MDKSPNNIINNKHYLNINKSQTKKTHKIFHIIINYNQTSLGANFSKKQFLQF